MRKLHVLHNLFKQFDARMEFISSMRMFSPFVLMFKATFSQYVEIVSLTYLFFMNENYILYKERTMRDTAE